MSIRRVVAVLFVQSVQVRIRDCKNLQSCSTTRLECCRSGIKAQFPQTSNFTNYGANQLMSYVRVVLSQRRSDFRSSFKTNYHLRSAGLRLAAQFHDEADQPVPPLRRRLVGQKSSRTLPSSGPSSDRSSGALSFRV